MSVALTIMTVAAIAVFSIYCVVDAFSKKRA